MIRENINRVQERIAAACECAGRQPLSVTLVAVSKTFPAGKVREAYECGLRRFGENRVQEAEGKVAELRDLGIEWHLVGHLQSNKAGKAAEIFQYVESLDALKPAEKLNQARESSGEPLLVLLQVDLGREETKFGIPRADVLDLARRVSELPRLRIRGLMTMPPYSEDPEQARPYFRSLRELAESISRQKLLNVSMEVLSMGMSHDFEVAIEEGSTMVRVGTAIFGSRSAR